MVKTLILSALLVACTTQTISPTKELGSMPDIQERAAMTKLLRAHLDAVETRNVALLRSTLSPSGDMELILPDSEVTTSVDAFIAFHEKWFQDPSWTMEFEILRVEVGTQFGIATTSALYKEPVRNGEPYFNRMIVSYVLEKQGVQWYVVKDHASSVEKTK